MVSLPNIIYQGPPIDDWETYEQLPKVLQSFYQEQNGFIGLNGGLHIRGCVESPNWHSLKHIWKGPENLAMHYDIMESTDIPFGQDAFGDQLIYRKGAVYTLSLEIGELDFLAPDWRSFWKEIETDAIEFLGLSLYQDLYVVGKGIHPGQLINTFPPFIFKDSDGKGRSHKPVDALEHIRSSIKVYHEIKGIPDGTKVKFSKE